MSKDKEFVYKSTLKSEYGLTDSLIRKLGKPDRTCPNPNYKSGPPAGLYRVARVKRFIQKHSEEIETAAAKREGRRNAAAKGVETKTKQLVNYAETTALKFAPLPSTYEELENLAFGHAVDRHGADAFEPGYKGVAAYVRHNFTNYEKVLSTFRGKVGGGRGIEKSPAYLALREWLDAAVDEHIEKTYPDVLKGRIESDC